LIFISYRYNIKVFKSIVPYPTKVRDYRFLRVKSPLSREALQYNSYKREKLGFSRVFHSLLDKILTFLNQMANKEEIVPDYEYVMEEENEEEKNNAANANK